MKLIFSKYAGSCKCCGKPIQRGALIAWSRDKGAQHPECAAKQESQAPDIGRMVDTLYEDQCAAACGLL